MHKTFGVPCLYETYIQGGKADNKQEKQIQISKNSHTSKQILHKTKIISNRDMKGKKWADVIE